VLGKALGTNSTLQELACVFWTVRRAFVGVRCDHQCCVGASLSNNNIGEEGGVVMGKALGKNSSLQMLVCVLKAIVAMELFASDLACGVWYCVLTVGGLTHCSHAAFAWGMMCRAQCEWKSVWTQYTFRDDSMSCRQPLCPCR